MSKSGDYNSTEARMAWKAGATVRETMRIGFPYARAILRSVSRSLRIDYSLAEDALMEAWMDLAVKERENPVEVRDNLGGYLHSFVRNKALNLRRRELRQEELKHEL